MLVRISKIGIIISLFLVAHALVYPNRYSLIIAILGYLIALISATIYGLYKPSGVRQTILEEIPEQQSEGLFDSKNVIDTKTKLFSLGLINLGKAHAIQGASLSTISRPLLDDDIEYDINKMIYTIPFERLDKLEMLRRYSRSVKIDEDTYKEDILPGYQ